MILSETAGAFQELGKWVLQVDPFDLDETAGAIASALQMHPDERGRRSRGLRAAVRRNPPERWVRAQLRDLER